MLRGRWINIQCLCWFPQYKKLIKNCAFYKTRGLTTQFSQWPYRRYSPRKQVVIPVNPVVQRERERKKQIYFHPSGAVCTVNTTTHQSFSFPSHSEAEEIEAQLSEVSTTATEQKKRGKPCNRHQNVVKTALSITSMFHDFIKNVILIVKQDAVE